MRSRVRSGRVVEDGLVERLWSFEELSERRWERGPDGMEEIDGAAGGEGARSSGVTSPGLMKTSRMLPSACMTH